MPDLTVQILKQIRSELRELHGRFDTLTDRVERGFAEVNARIDQTNARLDQVNVRLDNVILIVGSHHSDHEKRLARIERHLGWRKKS